VPEQPLCCGRPLYDFGMLDRAKRLLQQTIATLRSEIRAGIPVIALEPSCAAVFRDELVELFLNDGNARRLSEQTYLFSEFLTRHLDDRHFPTINRRAVVHGHCHHKAVMGMRAEEEV